MGFDTVAADSDDLRTLGFELIICIAKLRRLVRSTRGVVLRVEPQHQRLSGKIREIYGFACVVHSGYVGNFDAFGQH